MRCDQARPLASVAFDDAIGPAEADALAAHVDHCPDCRAFVRHIEGLRRELRFELADDAPDVVPVVLAELRGRPRGRHPAWAAVAVFAVAALVGASLAGLDWRRPADVAAASIPERVLRAQTAVETLEAEVAVVERGWHPDVGERRFVGSLAYRAPEALAIRLADRTTYPDPSWRRHDVVLVAAGDTWWSSGQVTCPTEALPACQPAQPRVLAVTGREPFGDDALAPLDLVVPVRSFALSAPPTLLGERTVNGRTAIGVRVTVAQVAPLLDGLRAAGHWRGLHPTDVAEVWLDADALVPLAVQVTPGASQERALWAARHGHTDVEGTTIFEMTLSGVRVNADMDQDAFAPPPAGTDHRDAGFRDAGSAVPVPAWVPDGMTPYRRGELVTRKGPGVSVATWTDGRAWLKVRTTRDWPGGRLFGDLGQAVRRVDLPAGGAAYVDEAGTAVALHAGDLDVVVEGSLPADQLLRVADSLGVTGLPVPAGWREASTAALGDLPGPLLVPRADLAGFAAPTVRRDADAVTIAWAGPGDRGAVLTQGPGARLAPPLDPDVTGVALRGTTARHTHRTGELEWTEAGLVVSLRSRTLSLAELVSLAESLEVR